jgi:hypothetical protein
LCGQRCDSAWQVYASEGESARGARCEAPSARCSARGAECVVLCALTLVELCAVR